MKILTVFFLIFFYVSEIFAQELLLEKTIELKSNFLDVRESLPVVNTNTDQIVLFLLDKKNVNAIILSSDYKLLNEIKSDKPPKKYFNLLGHQINSSGYDLVFTNKKKDEFYIHRLDNEGATIDRKELEIKLDDEKFLETLTHKNRFYLLTAKKKSSILNIYSIENANLTAQASIDFKNDMLINSRHFNLFDILLSKNNSTFVNNIEVHKIENSDPNSLDLASKENKLYCFNDKMIISIDKFDNKTILLSINLNDYSSTVAEFEKPKVKVDGNVKIKSNSFILDGKLYQVKGCKDGLSFHVADINSGSIIESFGFESGDEISFRNTSLIQKGGSLVSNSSERELESSKQALRKIKNSDIGITAWLTNDNIELSIGSYKETQIGGSSLGAMNVSSSPISTSIGTVNINSYHYNPTMFAFSSYKNSKSVYFKSLLDKNSFSHIEGKISQNVFDKLSDFEDDFSKDMVCQTLFPVNDYYVFGYYYKKNDTFYLRKFKK